ncbi:hypothetical protein CgunFtcFv8_019286 [Champsocephalus gunnari]|uniref:Uncharacterized protein n=1 Tax=Champsocephalus gunnari TaxID=52237 RepID=A0AAN8DGR7_CHAGU|nr:hypothetical protein CgunFtcFv8_019286 [Champsocephalus gunnari]
MGLFIYAYNTTQNSFISRPPPPSSPSSACSLHSHLLTPAAAQTALSLFPGRDYNKAVRQLVALNWSTFPRLPLRLHSLQPNKVWIQGEREGTEGEGRWWEKVGQ